MQKKTDRAAEPILSPPDPSCYDFSGPLLLPVSDEQTLARDVRIDSVFRETDGIPAILGFDIEGFGKAARRIRPEYARDTGERSFGHSRRTDESCR